MQVPEQLGTNQHCHHGWESGFLSFNHSQEFRISDQYPWVSGQSWRSWRTRFTSSDAEKKLKTIPQSTLNSNPVFRRRLPVPVQQCQLPWPLRDSLGEVQVIWRKGIPRCCLAMKGSASRKRRELRLKPAMSSTNWSIWALARPETEFSISVVWFYLTRQDSDDFDSIGRNEDIVICHSYFKRIQEERHEFCLDSLNTP